MPSTESRDRQIARDACAAGLVPCCASTKPTDLGRIEHERARRANADAWQRILRAARAAR